MNIPESYSQQYMDIIVGNPAARANFEASVRYYAGGFPDIETAYGGLEHGALQASLDGVRRLFGYEPKTDLDAAVQDSFNTNLPTGINISVAVCRAVGTMYEQHAAKAQSKPSVEQNLDRIMRYAYGLAFTGAVVATYSLEAIKQGRNAKNIANFPFIFRKMIGIPGTTSAGEINDFHKGIIVCEGVTPGEIKLMPKYPILSKIRERRCPVATTKTEGAKSPSALLTFMRTVGGIALEDIYPRQFAIND